MGTLLEELDLSGKTGIFPGRQEAGRLLAQRLATLVNNEGIVLAIPAGGVPVACEIAKALRLSMDVLIVRKIQIPGNTEAGFGAIGPEGEILLNESLLHDLRLTRKEIEEQVAQTREVQKQREARFRKGRPFPELKGKQVILVDDGLASGYTMLAAIGFVRQREAAEVIVAVPTASRRTVTFLLPMTDVLVCPNIRGGPIFAVADAYEEWYDLNDEEVLKFLNKAGIDTSPAS